MNEPLLLLPGMMCDARLFQHQINLFSASRPVMCCPLIGHDNVGALANNILSVAPDRFALAGLSMGGIVAMEMIRQAPERISRLALLDTNPKAEHPKIAELRQPQITAVQNGQLDEIMRDQMKPNYLTNGPNRTKILDLCLAMARSVGPDAFVMQSRALQSRPDQQDTLRGVTVPTLVLCGEDDALCPLHRHTLMQSLVPDAVLKVINGAGHLPTLEQPDATNVALSRWLNA